MRAAVYSGTRNLYPDMVTAAKSLIANSNVEKVYFLIEDDTFPEKLPPMIETINVSGQEWFTSDGANFRTSFTYMSLLRVCYTKLLPKEVDRVLQLDVDTIVTDDISELWDIDMTGKWFAAVLEENSKYKPYSAKYYNIGVAMFNLEQIRKDEIDDKLIKRLNSTHMPYIDQDAWNWAIAHKLGKDMTLPSRFNESFVTEYSDAPAIVHFAGFKNWQTSTRAPRREYIKKYRGMTWKEATRGKNPNRRTDV